MKELNLYVSYCKPFQVNSFFGLAELTPEKKFHVEIGLTIFSNLLLEDSYHE